MTVPELHEKVFESQNVFSYRFGKFSLQQIEGLPQN